MCLAVPLRIVKVVDQTAKVELGGVLRDISLALTPEARAGDYVLVHTGFAISVLDEADAQETLALFDELEEATRRMEMEDQARVDRSRYDEGEDTPGEPAQ